MSQLRRYLPLARWSNLFGAINPVVNRRPGAVKERWRVGAFLPLARSFRWRVPSVGAFLPLARWRVGARPRPFDPSIVILSEAEESASCSPRTSCGSFVVPPLDDMDWRKDR